MAVEREYFWDSCVLIAYLCDETHAYDIDSIKAHLEDARTGRIKIYVSSIAAAEVLPSRLKVAPSFEDFMDDYLSAIVPFDPSPNVMTLAARLRDLPYMDARGQRRTLSTPDAIMLATAVHLGEAWSVRLAAIHTFDKGGRKDADGSKSVPILGYENCCTGFDPEQMVLAERVIRITRCPPIHPNPKLPYDP
ncbi:PIN domain-containing protein (plasmid) [Roseomonas marmotae]|uniref:type II toxin-antitoxin system VapC family toxin n=1 Tax=Roseomonas marmotae TaxID=2768161 RepID=UPI001AD64FB3|nr:PIN domain-containing protein [Roseomonas marmotae]QTI81204.1 PIN domain-containing protein [Roseomonas marmotae]